MSKKNDNSDSNSSSNKKLNNAQSSDTTVNSDSNDKSEENKMTQFTILSNENNDKTPVEFIYHISDIHIRMNTRHVEYQEVFQRLYNFIKNDKTNNGKNSIVVITGDVLHSKTDLIPECIMITSKFFKDLSD